MKNVRAREYTQMFQASMASGIGQAIAGWAAEFTQKQLEDDPELRAAFYKSWLRMHRRITTAEKARERPRRTRRPRG